MTGRYSPQERTEAIDLYVSRGGKYAEAETGIKANTIRQWAKRAGRQLSLERRGELTEQQNVASEEWATRRIRLANRFGEVAEQALEAASTSISEEYSQDASAYAATSARLAEKAQLLSGAATARLESSETIQGQALELLANLEDQMRSPDSEEITSDS